MVAAVGSNRRSREDLRIRRPTHYAIDVDQPTDAAIATSASNDGNYVGNAETMSGCMTHMAEIGEIEPVELKARRERGDNCRCSTCANPRRSRSRLFRTRSHIPMGDIPSRLAELDPEAEWVVVCHHGMRSAQVAMYLARMGFEHVSNLSGGIDGVVADGRSGDAALLNGQYATHGLQVRPREHRQNDLSRSRNSDSRPAPTRRRISKRPSV